MSEITPEINISWYKMEVQRKTTSVLLSLGKYICFPSVVFYRQDLDVTALHTGTYLRFLSSTEPVLDEI